MIYQATAAICEAFDQAGIRYSVNEAEEMSSVEASFKGKTVASARVCFISKDESNDVAVRLMCLLRAPAEKRAQVLEQINSVNRKYRFLKFVLSDNGNVHGEYDFPAELNEVGAVAVELLARTMQIVDEAYPDLMHAAWS